MAFSFLFKLFIHTYLSLLQSLSREKILCSPTALILQPTQETSRCREPAFLKHCLCPYGLFYCKSVVLLTCKILSRHHLTHLGDIYIRGCQSPTLGALLLELRALPWLVWTVHLAMGTACFNKV